jgi:hypothetical protein
MNDEEVKTKEIENAEESQSSSESPSKKSRRRKTTKNENEVQVTEKEVKKPAANSYAARGPLLPGESRFHFSWDEFDKLCALHCTLEEIAGFFNVAMSTVEARVQETYGVSFHERFKLKSSLGRVSLRRKQYERAMQGDKTMLKHLGEHWLDQRTKFVEGEATPAAALVQWLTSRRKPDDEE